MIARRRSLLAASWIAIGILGFLAGRWTADPAPVITVVPPRSSATAMPGEARSSDGGPAAAPDGVLPRPGGVEPAPAVVEGDGGTAAGPGDASLATGTVLVRVVDEEGEPETDVDVYALPAGAPGVDDIDDVPHALTDGNGIARLQVLAGVPFDVGTVCLGARDMARDVTVAAGGTVPLDFTLRYGSMVRVRLEGWPPPGPGRYEAMVHLEAVREDGSTAGLHDVPGRADGVAYSLDLSLEEETEDTCLFHPPGARLRYSALVLRKDEGRGRFSTGGVGFDVPGGVVKDGGTLVLRVVGAPRVSVRLRTEVPLREGEGPVGRMWITQGATSVPVGLLPVDGAVPAAFGNEVALPGEGPFTVSWGPTEDPGDLADAGGSAMLEPGSATFPAAWDGQVCEVVARWRTMPEGPAGDRPRGREPVPVILTGAAATGAGPPSVALMGWRSPPEGEDRDPDSVEVFTFDGGSEPVVPSYVRGHRLMAFRGPFFVSDVSGIPPEAGSVEMRMRPAGMLVLAPSVFGAPALGALRVRRADGVPIPVRDYLDEHDQELLPEGLLMDPVVMVGRLLGPLPAGPVTFEVRRGGVRLRDVTVTVRAGRFTFFEVPEVAR